MSNLKKFIALYEARKSVLIDGAIDSYIASENGELSDEQTDLDNEKFEAEDAEFIKAVEALLK